MLQDGRKAHEERLDTPVVYETNSILSCAHSHFEVEKTQQVDIFLKNKYRLGRVASAAPDSYTPWAPPPSDGWKDWAEASECVPHPPWWKPAQERESVGLREEETSQKQPKMNVHSLVLGWCPQRCPPVNETWDPTSSGRLCAALLSELKEWQWAVWLCV